MWPSSKCQSNDALANDNNARNRQYSLMANAYHTLTSRPVITKTISNADTRHIAGQIDIQYAGTACPCRKHWNTFRALPVSNSIPENSLHTDSPAYILLNHKHEAASANLEPQELIIYLIFFLGRSWLVCPHFFLRQLVARGCSLA